MLDIHEVLPGDPDAFACWYDALRGGALAGRVDATIFSWESFASSLSSPSPVRRRLAVGAWSGAVCVGAVLLELPLRSDLETAEVEIAVPPAHRGRGVGASLWEWALDRARAEGRTILQAEVHVPDGVSLESWPGGRFALARGFETAHREHHLVLDLPVDPGRLAGLGPVDPDYRVEAWSGACPPGHLDALAVLRTAMSVDVPTGELAREPVVHTAEDERASEERQARSWTVLTALALARVDDEPVGYSTLFVPRTEAVHLTQDDTLVLRAHRGHGLGAALKAANLRALVGLPSAARARQLHTWTALDNAPMLAVNDRSGFRRAEVLHEVQRG